MRRARCSRSGSNSVTVGISDGLGFDAPAPSRNVTLVALGSISSVSGSYGCAEENTSSRCAYSLDPRRACSSSALASNISRQSGWRNSLPDVISRSRQTARSVPIASSDVGFLFARDRYPFWVSDTDCVPISIAISLAPLSKVIRDSHALLKTVCHGRSCAAVRAYLSRIQAKARHCGRDESRPYNFSAEQDSHPFVLILYASPVT